MLVRHLLLIYLETNWTLICRPIRYACSTFSYLVKENEQFKILFN